LGIVKEVAVKKGGAIVMLYSKDEALKNFLNSEPLTDDVHKSILDARCEDAEYDATHGNFWEKCI